MDIPRLTVCALALQIAACASHEGRYAPSCPSFAGIEIRLSDGQFVWDKFTDQVTVDADGNIEDAFPDYPKRGRYRIENSSVTMTAENGESMPVMHLVQHDDRTYLLDDAQLASWQASGNMDRCALALESR